MRGIEADQPALFSYVNLEGRVRRNHPLRTIKTMVDTALKELSPRFGLMYSRRGRPSVPPEQLLRALLLQMGIRAGARRLALPNHLVSTRT